MRKSVEGRNGGQAQGTDAVVHPPDVVAGRMRRRYAFSSISQKLFEPGIATEALEVRESLDLLSTDARSQALPSWISITSSAPSVMILSFGKFDRILSSYNEVLQVDCLTEMISSSVMSSEISEEFHWNVEDETRCPTTAVIVPRLPPTSEANPGKGRGLA